MKIIAYYLPQFHEIPENNKWWGEGFTEWTNVKKAEPLFSGHRQPRVPLNENYYDLSDVTHMESQAKLAKKYNVDGFCFYHYWFDGKLLLEKPLLNFLENKSIDIEFCLSWANEPWARTWDGKDTDVLIAQNYGDKNDWEKHFKYLLQYFNDPRYIKIDEKPMLVLYKTKDIENAEEMLVFWNDLAKKSGFSKGLYIVETLGGRQNYPALKGSSAVVEFEPSLTLGARSNTVFWIKNKVKMFINKGLYKINYNEVCKASVKRNVDYKKTRYLGCFPDWDNTPRKGKRGVVFEGSCPSYFEEYLHSQVKKSNESSFLFINAWNEWAEGAYLEPDCNFSFKYLEAIQKVKRDISKLV